MGRGKDGGAFGVTGHLDSGQFEVLGYTLRGAQTVSGAVPYHSNPDWAGGQPSANK